MQRTRVEVGQMIRRRREECRLTQDAFDGVSSSTIRKIENGHDGDYRGLTMLALAEGLMWPNDFYERLIEGDSLATLARAFETQRLTSIGNHPSHVRVEPVETEALLGFVREAVVGEDGEVRPLRLQLEQVATMRVEILRLTSTAADLAERLQELIESVETAQKQTIDRLDDLTTRVGRLEPPSGGRAAR